MTEPSRTPSPAQHPAALAPPLPPANERFKARWENGLWLSIAAATVVHFVVIAAWPQMSVAVEAPEEAPPIRVVDAVMKIETPEAPEPLTRPAIPAPGEFAVAPDAVIDAPLPELPDFDIVAPPPPPTGTPSSTTTRFVPYTAAPLLRNEREIERILQREYPSFLRQAGVGGQVVVWAFVGIDGSVGEAEVRESSGYEAMDAAALRVATQMRFRPAKNLDRTMAVWVSIPITFRVRDLPAGAPAATGSSVG